MSFDEEHLDDHHECRGEIRRLEAEIEQLRAELAAADTSSRIAETQRKMAVLERDECRALLWEACDMPPQLGSTGLMHTVTGNWLKRARAAGGGE